MTRAVRYLIALVPLAWALFAVAPTTPAPRPVLQPVSSQVLPARALRGYGTLAGTFTQFTGGGARASLLRIQCESAAKAQILQAKYLSDLHLFGPVQDGRLSVGKMTLPVVVAPDQGTLAAVRSGAAVYVLAAERQSELPALLERIAPSERKVLSPTCTATVPMYLDSWDKHGFRYYYWPGQTPPNTQWKDYHVLGEFDFAKQYGPMGIVLWATEDMVDFADGFLNAPIWDWAARSAARRKLPVVLNTEWGESSWLLNRYRDDARQMAPQYTGGFYGVGESGSSGKGNLSWCSTESADVELSLLQHYWRTYSRRPTTIEYLLPQGEMRHGDHETLLEYGPVADRSYRRFLQQRYGTLQAVGQRWYGDAGRLTGWEQVRVPELAHFLGYGPDALDLAGAWRFRYEDSGSPAPDAWYQQACDDSSWPALQAPGSDVALFTPHRPAVFRRHVQVEPAWRAQHPRVWLYVFDLAKFDQKVKMPVFVNGRKVGEDSGWGGGAEHWGAYEVTDALRDGDNLVALKLVNGLFGYRCYLSGQAPAEYPYLGAGMNAQWADFVRWKAWSRMQMLRRTFSALRQEDPNRSVICMSPYSYLSGIKQLCEQYGGHFHDTGGMAGWWSEPLPMLMRGADLPFSLEPGGPAPNVDEFRLFLGNWATEGVNAIHYFIHIGDIYWNDAIRKEFLADLPVVTAFGKHHIPKAEIAILFTDDAENLTGFPWGRNRGDNLPSGYVPTQLNMALHRDYHKDAISDLDFLPGGAADGYRVIIDSNTSVMDPGRVAEIAGWVRRGGTFITFNQTGRHTPETPDAWPISALTGYKVVKVDLHDRDWQFVPGQPVYNAGAWQGGQRGSGLSLAPADPACRDLIRWDDGTVAVGMRPLGKGRVINVGITYPYDARYIVPLLEWLKVRRIPMQVQGDAARVRMTHSVSNNGLYDVWTLWQEDRSRPATVDLAFRDGLAPAWCFDLKAGKRLPVAGGHVAGVVLQANETRIYLTPRGVVTRAPLEWLNLQRNWWRGTEKPGKPVPPYHSRLALDLSDGWARKLLSESDTSDQTPLAQPAAVDRGWPRVPLEVWTVPDELPTRHAFFRKSFTVPAGWKNGDLQLWLQGWQIDVVQGRMRVWLDGAEIWPLSNGRRGIAGLDLTGKLPPGSRHLLAVEIVSEGETAGPCGHTWLYYLPKPQATQSLDGEWSMTQDLLTYGPSAQLPGAWDGLAARRTFRVDKAQQGRSVVLHMESDLFSGLTGVIINGHWVMRLHHDVGTRTILNITPWVRFGEENELIVKKSNPGKTTLRKVGLDFYDGEVYP